MRVKYVGQQGDPDEVTAFGFRFSRISGNWVDVPDGHPKAQKFVNNPTFEVDDAPAGLVIDPPILGDRNDVSSHSPGNKASAAAPRAAIMAPAAPPISAPPPALPPV